MIKSKTQVVPARAMAGSADKLGMHFIIDKLNPDGSITVIVEMKDEAFDLIRRMASGNEKRRFGFFPVVQVDLMARAKIGDHEPLIRHFERGGDITEDERRLLAAIARGALPAPQNRPQKIATELRDRDVARFVAVLKLLGGKRVADIAAAKFRIDRGYAAKQFRKHGNLEGCGARILKSLFLAFGANEAMARNIMLQYANVTEADVREATQQRRWISSRK
jgi:hypothetical protein